MSLSQMVLQSNLDLACRPRWSEKQTVYETDCPSGQLRGTCFTCLSLKKDIQRGEILK